MSPSLKNFLAVVAGLIFGSVVNMGIISMSGSIIPPPANVDNTTMEGLKASMHLFGPEHFIFPFLAHALGTFAGAFVAARFGVYNKMRFALIIVFFFLAGGVASVFMLPPQIWLMVGAFVILVTAWVAANNKMHFALIIGLFFLAGGISSVFMLPSPTWFAALDLVVAYLPMAYLAGKLATRNTATVA